VIELDGAAGEGGGQIVRIALALSALTGQPFRVTRIRAGRRNPGLKAQHLTAVRALEKLCGGVAEGATLGSAELTFIPGPLTGRTVAVDIGTAGSIPLLLQAILLPALGAPDRVRLKLTGGTDVPASMPWDYFERVCLPIYRCLGDISTTLGQRGHYPAGGGHVEVVVRPATSGGLLSGEGRCEAAPIELRERGALVEIRGVSFCSEALRRQLVAERQATGARHALSHLGVPVRIERQYGRTESIGTGIVLVAVFERVSAVGADALGEISKRAEEVGREAALKLLAEIEAGAVVDRHAVDTVLPLLALTGGALRTSELTSHAATSLETVRHFRALDVVVEGAVIELHPRRSL